MPKNKFLFFLAMFIMFFCSGFCGLLYQIVWMRLAYATYGVNTPVLSVVISVFMMGLALGSWLAGITVSGIVGKLKIASIFLYALAELLIGVGAFAVPKLFALGGDVLLKLGEMDSFSYLLASAICIVISILPWCIFMGMTFPLMMSYVKETAPSNTTSFSFLYVANVLGALVGTFLTVIAFIELFGFSGALIIGAAINFSIAFIGFFLGWFSPLPKAKATALKKVRLGPQKLPLGSPTTQFMVSLLFLTGFCSMAMEVVWTRAFIPILKNEVYSFGMILFTYLLSTWLGSTVYRKGLANGKIYSNEVLLAWLAISGLFPVVLSDPRCNKYVLGILFTIVPFCALLGYLTPKLVDDVSRGNPEKAGKAYAVNVIGCILGPLFASYLFLPWLGVKLSLAFLTLPFLILTFPRRKFLVPRGMALPVTATALMLFAVFISQSYETLEKGITRRDYTATVINNGEGRDRMLFVNGIRMTCLVTTTKFMAHLPLCLLDHKPENALTICLGMGGTFRSLLTWGIKATAVELTPSVRDSFGFFFSDAEKLLKDPRAKIIIDDGRRYLKRTNELYDVITVDPPPPPQAAGCSLLMSKEFFGAVKSHLKKGGIFQIWYYGDPYFTDNAFYRAILESFPYVKVFPSDPPQIGGRYFIASMEPIQVPPVAELIAKLPPAAQADIMEWAPPGQNLESYASPYFKGSYDAKFGSTDENVNITDDCPYNEYYFMRFYLPRLTSWIMERMRWLRSQPRG